MLTNRSIAPPPPAPQSLPNTATQRPGRPLPSGCRHTNQPATGRTAKSGNGNPSSHHCFSKQTRRSSVFKRKHTIPTEAFWSCIKEDSCFTRIKHLAHCLYSDFLPCSTMNNRDNGSRGVIQHRTQSCTRCPREETHQELIQWKILHLKSTYLIN